MGKYTDLSNFIIENIGGKDNVSSITHCATRLRIKLKDESKAKDNIIKQNDGIINVLKSAGQYQIIIGTHVGEVFEEINKVANFSGIATFKEHKKTGIIQEVIEVITGVLTPCIGVLCATGILKGVLAIFTVYGVLSKESSTYIILSVIGNSLFYYFPVVLGYTAAKKFNLNIFVGILLGGILVHPSINAIQDLSFLGIPIIMPTNGYTSTIIPIILAVWVASKIEKIFDKIIPTIVKSFLLPLCTLLIAAPITLLVVGPVATYIAEGLGIGVQWIYNINPILLGIVLGAVWQILIIFGVHWGVAAIMYVLVASGTDNMIGPTTVLLCFSQTAVVLAMAIKTKSEKLRAICIPSVISGLFGVTEPAIYAITLPRKIPFIISCIGGAIHGAIAMALGVVQYNLGGMGIFAFTRYINTETGDMSSVINVAIASLIGASVSFILTMVIYKDSPEDLENEKNKEVIKSTSIINESKSEEMFSPLSGELKELTQVDDPAFSSGVFGKGLAIEPTEGKLFSPVDGEIVTIFPTYHAIAIKSEKGAELLIHVGMDTVNLEGKYFTPKIKAGDKVKKGDLLLEFDILKIKELGYSTVTPIVLTNTDNYDNVETITGDKAEVGDIILSLK